MSRHLGDVVSAYVDRRLSPAALASWDRHVVVCAHCRYAVDQERGLLASLRSAAAPTASESLHAVLLGLCVASPHERFLAAAGSPTTRDPAPGPGVPSIPTAPLAISALRLPTVCPADPPRHRSARRAALLAGLAAGASAATAWTVGLAPVAASASPGSPAPTRWGAVSGAGAAYSGMLSFPVSQVGFAVTRIPSAGSRPAAWTTPTPSTMSAPATISTPSIKPTTSHLETPGR